VLALVASVEATEIVQTSSYRGELFYYINCTNPCTVKIYSAKGVLQYNSSYDAGVHYGSASLDAGEKNVTLWEGSTLKDSITVNMGVFSPGLEPKLKSILGASVLGTIIMFGVAISAVTIGKEAGIIFLGLGTLVASQSGMFPEWTFYVVALIAFIAFGVGLYELIRGWIS
jgi:hypothetical protein